MKRLLSVMALVLVMMLAACNKDGSTGATPSEDKKDGGATYALVNGREVSKAKYDQIYNMYLNTMAAQYKIAEKAKDAVVHEVVLMEEIEKQNIEVTEDMIKADYEEAIKASGSKEEHLKILEQYGISEEDDKANMRLSTHFRAHRKWFDNSFPVKEDNIKEYYEKNKDNLDSVVASHILLDTEEEALACKVRLDEGEDFATLAAELSKDPVSKENGGSLGETTFSNYVPEFAAAARTQEIGVIGEPVKTKYGYHIIRVDERKIGAEQNADMIKTMLGDEAYDKYLKGLFEGATVELK